jgi:xanthine dehydrogenase accessory factor
MDIYEKIVSLRREGHSAALATIINVRGSIPSFASAKMIITDDGNIFGTIGGGCVEAEVWQTAREVLATKKPRILAFNLNKDPKYDTGLVCGGSLEIFVEPIFPTSTLYIFGAGHVGWNVYRVAHVAGFDAVVADDREAYANRERFPEASEVYAEEFDQVLAKLNPPKEAFIVIATRGHRDDMKILRWAVGTQAHYIGMVGSKRKVVTIYKTLEKEGVPQEKLDLVHSPIGLDIGATTPEEIGVSIVAELIAVRRNAEAALPHMRLLRKLAEAAPATTEKTEATESTTETTEIKTS